MIELVDLAESPLREARASRTFDGRDLFGPVAGALAAGHALSEVGRPVDASSLMVLAIPAPAPLPGGLATTVLEVDSFGTLVLALDDQADHVGELPGMGAPLSIEARGMRHAGRVGRTFADVARGELVLYRDSDGALALALRDGSAASVLGIGAGGTLTLLWGTTMRSLSSHESLGCTDPRVRRGGVDESGGSGAR